MGTAELVLVGYLITHPDGWQVRMGPDKARADLYAAKQHAIVEELLVRREARQDRATERIDGMSRPG